MAVVDEGGEPTPDAPRSHARPPGTAPFLPDAWWGLSLIRRRQIAGAVLVALVVPPAVLLRPGGGSSPPTTTGEDAAAYVADMPAQRVATFDSLAQCESGGDWSDDTGNGFYGGLQFTLESWDAVGGTGNPAESSRDEQIMRGQMLQDEQGWEAWPSCARQLGLT
jgi:hypothetical protein